MGWLEILLIGVALSMDAAAVSIVFVVLRLVGIAVVVLIHFYLLAPVQIRTRRCFLHLCSIGKYSTQKKCSQGKVCIFFVNFCEIDTL